MCVSIYRTASCRPVSQLLTWFFIFVAYKSHVVMFLYLK